MPMVPLVSLHPGMVEEENSRAHAVVMPALRAILLQSLGRASQAVVAAAAGGGRNEDDNSEGWRHGEEVIANLTSLLRQEEQQQHWTLAPKTTRKGVNLFHLQTAFHAWASLVGESLPRLLTAAIQRWPRQEYKREAEEEEGQEPSRCLSQVLREEGACLIEAFRHRRTSPLPPSAAPLPHLLPTSTSTAITTDKQSGNEGRHRHPFKARLQDIGHHLSLRRAAAEARVARLFLQQCALVDVLRKMEDEEGEEEGSLYCALESLYEMLTERGREEGEEEGGLQAEVDVVEVRAMLRALMKEGGREGGLEEGAEGGSLQALDEACSVLEGGGDGDGEGGGRGGRGGNEGRNTSRQKEKIEYAAIDREESEGGKERGSEEEDDLVLEVFEGRSGAEAQPDSNTRYHQQQQQQQHKSKAAVIAAAIKHDALIGELERFLHHRQRQQPVATKVKVNGQVLMASSLSSLLTLEEEEEGKGEEEGNGMRNKEKGTTLSRDGGAGEVSYGMSAALLAAVLQQQQQQQLLLRGQNMGESRWDTRGVDIFDGEGEGEDEQNGEGECRRIESDMCKIASLR